MRVPAARFPFVEAAKHVNDTQRDEYRLHNPPVISRPFIMANTKKFAAVAAVSAVLIGSLFASLSTEPQDAFAKPVDVAQPAAQKVLRVGSLTAYPPFEYLDTESGRYEGFDMDLIREVGKRMDREIEIVSMGLDALVPALLAKSVDVAVSALTITPERAAKVDFTKPYYDAGLTIMTTKANAPKITGPESLENQCLCAEIGSAGAVYMKRIPGATIRTFNSAAEAFMELSQGGCFAMVNDRPVNEYVLAQKSSKGLGLTEMPYVLSEDQYGFAVNKQNGELLAQLNSTLDAMKADGSFDKIYRKWFGS